MNRGPATLCLALACLLAARPGLASPPPRVELEYEMRRNGTVMVELTEVLEHDGKTYRINSSGHGKGLYALANRSKISRSSRGTVGIDGLRPAEFRDQRGNDLSVAKFDWPAGKLVQEREGKSEVQPLPERAQDRLSFLWSFAFAPPEGDIVEAGLADGRGAPSRVRYRVVGTEVLKTAAGEIEALHLVKQRSPGDERGTELWLAAKRNYLPVRVLVIEKDGTRIDQVVTRIGS